MKTWDAIVVGAGPAGCACAYDLAAAGRSVLLLDKAVFPRIKACAGGLTTKSVRALRYSVEPVVRQVVHHIVLGTKDASSIPVCSREPICVMTVREELDAYCLKRTIEAGAAFQKIEGMRAIVQHADKVTVVTGDGSLQAYFLVGADGAHSQVRRMTGEAGWFRKGFAMEANLWRDAKDEDLVFDFAPVTQGYGWVFPKKDHLNIGLYSMAQCETLNRGRLAVYITQRFGAEIEAQQYIGQYLGFGAAKYQAEAGRVFLVGDAGGFADPLSGEGIYGAIVSGQAAAAAICAAGEEPAWAAFSRITAALRCNLRIAEQLAISFYADPKRGFNAMKIPPLRNVILKSYADGFNLSGLLHLVQSPLFRARRLSSS